MAEKPRIAITMGDAAGIGPEVIAKSLASGQVHPLGKPVVIGSASAMEEGIRVAKAKLTVRRVESVDGTGEDPGVIEVLDSSSLKPEEIIVAKSTAACGKAMIQWGNTADALVKEGKIQGVVGAPVNSDSLKLAGREMGSSAVTPGSSFLFLVSGPLRVVHLVDHMSMRDTIGWVKKDNIVRVLELMRSSLMGWGMPDPRIGVCGLNAHAAWEEEKEEIAPAVEEAKRRGIKAIGPMPPDSVFRQCIEGVYDVVLAMYHDQGHIAVKTWGFIGNFALVLGSPYVRISVAHGTAYDIAGKGVARHEMILAAMTATASLAAGKGFPKD